MPLLALTRGVSPSLVDCELTFLERTPIDLARAVEQHAAYRAFLAGCGAEVVDLPTDAGLPDCCFVEDCAVVLDALVVITRPGAASRRGETAAVEAALARHRAVARIEAPGTLDGGDVLVHGRRIFVGRTARTNDAGIASLKLLAAPLGYEVQPVEVRGCLHLKSAIAAVDTETLLIQPAWVEPGNFAGLALQPVPEDEPWAANVRRIGRAVGIHAGFPRTAEILARRGVDVRTVDISEFLKAEAGMTCLSVLVSSAA